MHQLHTRTQDGYKYWITFIEAKTKGQHMGEFQMDKGGEYISKAFLAFLRKHGIIA
jgi:hypothetical protein